MRSPHLASVKMNYFDHFIFSAKLSLRFMWGSFCAVIHAFIPDILVRSSSEIARQIIKVIQMTNYHT